MNQSRPHLDATELAAVSGTYSTGEGQPNGQQSPPSSSESRLNPPASGTAAAQLFEAEGAAAELTAEEEKQLAGVATPLVPPETQITAGENPSETRPVPEKAVVRAGTVLLLVGGITGFLFLLWQFIMPRPPESAVKQPPPSPPPTPISPTQEPAELKGQLAFAGQQRETAETPRSRKLRPVRKTQRTATKPVLPRPTSRFVRTPLPAMSRAYSPPPPAYRSLRTPSATLTPATSAISRQVPRSTQRASQAKLIDPLERWSQLAQLGERRATSESESAAATSTPRTAAASQETAQVGVPSPATSTSPMPQAPVAIQPTVRSGATNLPTNPDSAPLSSQTRDPVTPTPAGPAQLPQPMLAGLPTIGIGLGASSNMTPGEMGILSGNPLGQPPAIKTVAVGSSAAGQVVIPMAWNEADPRPNARQFSMELTQPLLAMDGTVALPPGTVLIAQVTGVASNQLVDSSVIAVVYPNTQGQRLQAAIPLGQLLIQGEANQPLVAQKMNDPGPEIFQQDALVGVLAGLSRVGEVINEPEEEVVIRDDNIFGSRYESRTSRDDPNLFGAALEGIFGVASDRLAERSDKALQEMEDRPNIAIVPKGTPVSVYVNSVLQVRR